MTNKMETNNDTYQIEVRVRFRYGHRLIEPYIGKCNNNHGEAGTAIIIFESNKLNDCDMVMDFGEVKNRIKYWINRNWDHTYIHKSNDEVGKYFKGIGLRTYSLLSNPTAECMAKHLYTTIKNTISPLVKKVGIIESF